MEPCLCVSKAINFIANTCYLVKELYHSAKYRFLSILLLIPVLLTHYHKTCFSINFALTSSCCIVIVISRLLKHYSKANYTGPIITEPIITEGCPKGSPQRGPSSVSRGSGQRRQSNC